MRTKSRGQEERGEVMSFVAQVGSRSCGKTEGKDKNTIHNHCNHSGHELDSYFQVISYPDCWGDHPRGAGQGTRRGKVGITAGGRGRGGTIKANVAQAANGVTTDTDKGAANGLSDEQWQMLLNLLNNTKTGAYEKLTDKHSSMQWIIDMGASHHMTRQLNCLSDVRDVMECPVGLPNAKHMAATKQGTVVLCDMLKLTNVLYVSSLHCNLIFVSLLLDDSNCVI